jgi:hypothetical protein
VGGGSEVISRDTAKLYLVVTAAVVSAFILWHAGWSLWFVTVDWWEAVQAEHERRAQREIGLMWERERIKAEAWRKIELDHLMEEVRQRIAAQRQARIRRWSEGGDGTEALARVRQKVKDCHAEMKRTDVYRPCKEAMKELELEIERKRTLEEINIWSERRRRDEQSAR